MIDNPDILVNYVRRCNAVTVDSRAISDLKKADKTVMFIALKGDKYDGNDFVPEALKAGADYVVSDNFAYDGRKDSRILIVRDSMDMMNKTALAYRRIVDPKVIAITGTNGKTTTKELAVRVLSKGYRAHATQGNLNNHIGVPLTLLNMPKDSEVVVVEMGASHLGEIANLCEIAEPNYGLITNIGRAHLEGFGSFEGVCKAKGELYDYLKRRGGIAFYDTANEHLVKMFSERMNLRKSSYNSEDFRGEYNKLGELIVSIKGKSTKINTMMTGFYNTANIAGAFAIAKGFGIEFFNTIEAIEEYCPANSRSQLIHKDSNIIISDAYNANPTSVDAAVKNLKHFTQLSKVVVLGAMKELGLTTNKDHIKVIKTVRSLDVTKAYFVGEEFMNVKIECDNMQYFNTTEELVDAMADISFEDSVILVKGSRSMELEKIIDKL